MTCYRRCDLLMIGLGISGLVMVVVC
jgi:hypothetical protein